MILGGGVAVCLLLSAHRAVIFAIAQLSCLFMRHDQRYVGRDKRPKYRPPMRHVLYHMRVISQDKILGFRNFMSVSYRAALFG